jgi:GT2 family glycosyltransferase
VTSPRSAVGVVVVNYRGADDTLECLTSLLAADPRPRAVVVVENGSGDDSATRIADWAARRGVALAGPDVEPPAAGAGAWLVLLRSVANRGFSGGNNLGLALLARRADVRHFLLLNNDATVAPDYFAQLARAIDAAPDFALMSGTIFHAAEPGRVWYAGGRQIPLRALSEHSLDMPSSPEPRPTEFVCGCTMLISRAAYDALGPLPECYFPGYVEDLEYSFRAWRGGMRLLYAPAAHAYHKIGGAFGVSPRVFGVALRHRGYFVRRNLRGAERVAATAFLAVAKSGRVVEALLRGRLALARALATGLATGLLGRGAHAGRDHAGG